MGAPGIIALSVCAYLVIGWVCATIGEVIIANAKTARPPLDDVAYGLLLVMWPFICVLFVALGTLKISRQLSSAAVRLLPVKRKEG